MEAGGSRWQQAGYFLTRDKNKLWVNRAHHAPPFPQLLADAASGKAGFPFASEFQDFRLRCLDLDARLRPTGDPTRRNRSRSRRRASDS